MTKLTDGGMNFKPLSVNLERMEPEISNLVGLHEYTLASPRLMDDKNT